MHATIFIGYLPVAKLDCYSEASHLLQGYWLFHHCMGMIFKSLIEAGREGVEMVYTDGWIWWVYVILAAYVADFLEQCLIECCMENCCPCFTVDLHEWGSPIELQLCNKTQMLETLIKHKQGRDPLQFKKKSLHALYKPFWADLPHCNIFNCFTSDLLHQLHKGIFKDHLVQWCTQLMS